jgi:transcriptional regulator with XRE-family HTH domain
MRIGRFTVCLAAKSVEPTISLAVLAEAIKTTANTISRWETATYKPSVSDLEKVARFFTSQSPLFPSEIHPFRTQALLTTARGLAEEDLEEGPSTLCSEEDAKQNSKSKTNPFRTKGCRSLSVGDALCHELRRAVSRNVSAMSTNASTYTNCRIAA